MTEPAAEPTMTAVRYDARSAYVLVTLSNGASLAFPASQVAGLAAATDEQLAAVEVAGDGHVLAWQGIGVYLSYLSILTDIFGARAHIVRLAGSRLKTAEDRASRPARRRPRR
jgi:hypothetical protein